MDTEVFCERMCHFISVVKLMSQEELLLILDGYSSHTQRLVLIKIVRKHGAAMQSLDIKFFQDIKYIPSIRYRSEAEGEIRGRVSTEHIAPLVHMAFTRTTTMESATNRFINCGFCLANRCFYG